MRLIALIATTALSFQLYGQTAGFDLSKIEPGIMGGINGPVLQPTFAPSENQSGDVLSVSKEQNPGISMGLTAAYPLTAYLEVRTALIYSRYDNKLKYLVQSGANGTTTSIKQPYSSTVEVPLHIVLAPSNFNSNPSLVAGPRYAYNLRKYAAGGPLGYTRHHLGMDVGASLTIPVKHFDLTPQLTYSFGLTPLATQGSGTIGGPVEEVGRNVWRLSIYVH